MDVDHHGGVHRVRHSNDVALVEVGLFQSRQIDSDPLTGVCLLHILRVDLQVADAAFDAGRIDGDRVADLHRSFDQSAGDDSTKALHREDAVDRDAEGDIQIFDLGLLVDHGKDSLPQLFDAFAGVGGNRDDLRIFQKGALHLLADFITDDFQPVLIDHVLFGDDDDAL